MHSILIWSIAHGNDAYDMQTTHKNKSGTCTCSYSSSIRDLPNNFCKDGSSLRNKIQCLYLYI